MSVAESAAMGRDARGGILRPLSVGKRLDCCTPFRTLVLVNT